MPLGSGNLLGVAEDLPAVLIDRYRAEFLALSDEAQFIAAVGELPPLADSDDSCWAEYDAWHDLYRLLAAADVVGDRGWRSAAGMLYERAALGDLNDAMQSIRHGPERAYRDDLDAFADVLEPLASHVRPGTRQWSVRELGILRLVRSVGILRRAAHDPIDEVRHEAISSLEMLAQRHSEAVAALAELG